MAEAFQEILATRVVMMPRDTNAHGTIFGGHILSLIDQRQQNCQEFQERSQ